MNLLVAESPLIVLPTLAARIGLEESIFLQQIHFLNTYSNNEKDGFKWVYNTYEEWVSIFPFFKNASKIKRIVSRLEGLGVLVTTSQYNRLKIDRRKWYRVNYESKLWNEFEFCCACRAFENHFVNSYQQAALKGGNNVNHPS